MCEKDKNDCKRLTTDERTTMVTEDELAHQMAAVTIADALSVSLFLGPRASRFLDGAQQCQQKETTRCEQLELLGHNSEKCNRANFAVLFSAFRSLAGCLCGHIN
jgi:hypothetical protein